LIGTWQGYNNARFHSLSVNGKTLACVACTQNLGVYVDQQTLSNLLEEMACLLIQIQAGHGGQSWHIHHFCISQICTKFGGAARIIGSSVTSLKRLHYSFFASISPRSQLNSYGCQKRIL